MGVGRKKYIENHITYEMILDCAMSKLSINQAARKLGLSSQTWLAKYIKNYPELDEIFKNNGYMRRLLANSSKRKLISCKD